ncbi:MAG: phosphatidate cytidylyltransferase [Terriglobia bacterium]
MKLRILTALVMAPLAFLIIGWSPEWLFLLVLVATIERGLYEYFSVTQHAGFKTVPIIGYAAACAMCAAQAYELERPGTLLPAISFILILGLLFTLIVTRKSSPGRKQFLSRTAATLFGILYIGFMLSWLVPMRFSMPLGGRNLTLLLFLVIWAGDIFALFVGRSLGRTPLAPRISPKKTVEGSVGGLIGSLVIGWAFAHWFWQTEPLKTVILYTALIAVAGQVGDLLESGLKRACEVKDSGTLLPGHGGLLDRIDSLILAVPALWLAVELGAYLK